MAGLKRRLLYLVFASSLLVAVYFLTTLSSQPSLTPATVSTQNRDSQRIVESDKLAVSDPQSGGILHALKFQPEGNGQPAHQTHKIIAEVPLDPPVAAPVPVVQSQGSSDPYAGPQNAEQKEIVAAFMHAWNAYKKYAWGHDELRPVSHGWQEWFGVGLTIVDSLDTAWIMGLKDEFKLGRDWVSRNMSLARDNDVQLFEVVIRILGGLMSAYTLSQDEIFLHKALDLGNRLYPCFSGPTKVPCNRINLHTGRGAFIDISTAETGTIQLEFISLARATRNRNLSVPWTRYRCIYTCCLSWTAWFPAFSTRTQDSSDHLRFQWERLLTAIMSTC